MYIKPVGSNPPTPEDRMPLWKVIAGDSLNLRTMLHLIDRTTPATPSNSIVTFALAGTRFDTDLIVTGTWDDIITEVDHTNAPGLVKIAIPQDASNNALRGTYIFSITVAASDGSDLYTAVEGNMLVEYDPTSPNKVITYKTLDGSRCNISFGSGGPNYNSGSEFNDYANV